MRIMRRLLGVLLLFALSAAGGPVRPAQAQASDIRYFDQTGHNVQGEFLRFFEQIPNPLEIYGYPITEEFQSVDGQYVQYFQRARFEYHPDLPAGQRIRLSPLGRLTYVPGDQIPYYNALGCDVFATGFPVCHAFLDYFERNGGLARFGQPISPFESHDGLIVQYFENARLEWRPWMPEGQRVGAADLGTIYFKRVSEDLGRLAAVPPGDNNILAQVLELQVHAFVGKAFTLTNDAQTVYVAVLDQTRNPVAGARGELVVQWPDGRTESYVFQCDTNGVAQVPLTVSGQPFGRRAIIRVTVYASDKSASTTTSFRIWH